MAATPLTRSAGTPNPSAPDQRRPARAATRSDTPTTTIASTAMGRRNPSSTPSHLRPHTARHPATTTSAASTSAPPRTSWIPVDRVVSIDTDWRVDSEGADEVAATFALGSVVEPPELAARGAQGFIWKVTTDRGAFAVKRLQSWVEAEPVPFDVHVQHAAEAVGIPLPRPVLTPNGEAMVARTRVYEWVELLPATPTPVTPAVAREVGDLLGRLHRLALPPPQEEVNTWFTEPPRLEDWDDLARRGADADAPWMAWLPDEIAFLDELGRQIAVPHTGPVITCHCDYAPGNVLPSAADGSLVVLDWENAGPLPADVELAWALVLWAVNGDRVDLAAAEALLDGYDRRPTLPPTAFHVALVTHVNFLKVNLDHSLDPEQRGEFADRWIDLLHPEGMRRRLVGFERLREALAAPT